MVKHLITAISVAISLPLLVACDPSIDDAKAKGFDTVEEMVAAKKQGFNTKDQVNEADAKKVGFANYEEMKARNSQGFKTAKDYEMAKTSATKAGFSSVEEMLEANRKGFGSKAEVVAAQEAEATVT